MKYVLSKILGFVLVVIAVFFITVPFYTSLKTAVMESGGGIAIAVSAVWMLIAVVFYSGFFLLKQAKNL